MTTAMRDHVIDCLRKEVLGPDAGYRTIQLNGNEIVLCNPASQLNGEEIILESPKNRYGAGILFPKRSIQVVQAIGSEADQPTDHEDDNEDGDSKTEDTVAAPPDEVEQEVGLTNEYLPSAMGLSALVDVPDELIIEISAARYERGPAISIPSFNYTKKDSRGIKYCDFPKSEPGPKTKPSWCRIPLQATLRISQKELLTKEIKAFWTDIRISDVKENLGLHIVTRPIEDAESGSNLRLITFTLVNLHESQNNTTRDEECFFQTQFKIRGPEEMPCFMPYPDYTVDETDQESQSLYLLYRHKAVFAVGHGCAANWSELNAFAANSIQTEALPQYEIRPVKPRTIEGLSLSMKELAFGGDQAVFQNLTRLADEYETWITNEAGKVNNDKSLTAQLSQTAHKHLKSCQEALKRMREGIELIKTNSAVKRSFRLMNEAMFMQRAHYRLSSAGRRIWEVDGGKLSLEPFSKPDYSTDESAWYPFQLGFILMNLVGIVKPDHTDRGVVDLIWFPTGGGKTEAYLGLTGFVLFFRRLRGDDSATTAVLMRYTLRLLTTQQFQRAASLICACEVLRTKNKDLGRTTFSIGLWVGGDVTPNTGEKAVKALNALAGGGDNKFIVTSCPWCGCQLGPVPAASGKGKTVKGYKSPTKSRVFIRCEDSNCHFADDRLPILVVDEDIYNSPPSLLVGTVDKFAMLPWLPQSGSIFGHSQGSLLPAPDLIIQDELHLISGPIGSVVGLYEPLVDLLSERDGISPKIIASTATISRADEQVKALYGRKSELFPPQALVAGDSFFAIEDTESPGRTYIGVFGSGYSSHATSQVRSMSALLQAAKLSEFSPAEIDPYWSLIGYFNSLRELGHAVTLVSADIPEYITVACERIGIPNRFDDPRQLLIRRIVHEEELTSRVNSADLPEKLNKLFLSYDGSGKCQAIDVCFATNMIQVGLDVSRLSLMAVVGQPKTTSEYIQASSRVGRDPRRPGLVVVNYNPSKPRDRSHFERFRQYHESIYRHVEPTSVTPFALPVRERALHALVIALVRLWGPSSIMQSPTGSLDSALIDRVTRAIVDRVILAEPDEAAGTETMINAIFSRWQNLPASRYGSFGNMDEEPVPLMYQTGSKSYFSWNDRSYETPNNMRSVDKDCEAKMIPNVYPTP